MMSLERKTALITGAGSGLGAALARCLRGAGARVVLADLNVERAAKVAREIDASGEHTLVVGGDVAEESAARALLEQTISRFGALDVLVNNAGTDVTAPIDELGLEDWDRVIRTNLRAPFLLSKLALPALRESDGGQGGQIVNIASTAARRAWPNASAYHASKFGLVGLSHALHAELRPLGVRVSTVVVGGMRTPFLLDRFPDIDVSKLQDPANVAETIRFLLTVPRGSVIPEVMVLPIQETSWP